MSIVRLAAKLSASFSNDLICFPIVIRWILRSVMILRTSLMRFLISISLSLFNDSQSPSAFV